MDGHFVTSTKHPLHLPRSFIFFFPLKAIGFYYKNCKEMPPFFLYARCRSLFSMPLCIEWVNLHELSPLLLVYELASDTLVYVEGHLFKSPPCSNLPYLVYVTNVLHSGARKFSSLNKISSFSRGIAGNPIYYFLTVTCFSRFLQCLFSSFPLCPMFLIALATAWRLFVYFMYKSQKMNIAYF